MASRRKGRILAFQALYAWDLSGNVPGSNVPARDVLKDNSVQGEPLEGPQSPEEDSETMPDFSRLLVAGTIENIGPIDAMIRRHLKNWDFSRLNRVDLAVLRMSVYALMYQIDTAPSIIINEAIGISKEFGTDDSYRFINGVLDGIRKSLETASLQTSSLKR
jgi:N utilization substance protein B